MLHWGLLSPLNMRTQPKVPGAAYMLSVADGGERDLILPWGCWAAAMWKGDAAASWGMLVSATSHGGHRDGDLRLWFFRVTSAGGGEAWVWSRAAPQLPGRFDAVCSTSIVCCWSQFPSAGTIGGTVLLLCQRDAETAGQGQHRWLHRSVLLGCEGAKGFHSHLRGEKLHHVPEMMQVQAHPCDCGLRC